MRLHVFGSCAGTEPIAGRHHTSLAFEVNGALYFFDAGENSSYTAHLMGLELRATRAVFISHTHMDHIGGLGNLFWNIRKLTTVDRIDVDHDIELHIPNLTVWDSLYNILRHTEGNFVTKFAIIAYETHEGIIYEDENITVEAAHNLHLPRAESEPWRSYSFRIRAEGKTLIYTGDVKALADCDGFLEGGCDALLTETGHHKPDVAPSYINERGFDVRKLIYVHNGGVLLHDKAEGERLIKAAWDGDYTITEDAMTLEL